MTHPSSPDRLTQIDAYLDGSLDPADFADFTAWLMSDPTAPDLLTEKSLVHSWLIDHHHATAASSSPSPMLSEAKRRGPIRIPHLAFAAAALIALALTAWFILSPTSSSESPSPPSTTVALLTNTDGAIFGESTVPTALGSALTPGKLTLTAGSAQIMFQRGAVVDLHAPATLHLINQNTARLERGELYATVPPAAAGFTVHGAEGLKVIDLGTEFSMHVVAGRGSDVRVFAGHVELEARNGMRLTLTAGQGAHYGGGAFTPAQVVIPKNALTNGGFDPADGFAHWVIFGPGVDEQQCREAGAWPQHIQRGDNGMIHMPVRSIGDNHVTGLYQDAPVTPGARCRGQINIIHTAVDAIAGDEAALCKLEFYDAAGRHIVQYESATQLRADSPVNEPLSAVVTAIAPPGAVTVRFVLIVDDPQSDNTGSVLFDDAELWINSSLSQGDET